MKKGDLIDVYQKPYTQENYEGEAFLVSFIRNDPAADFEDWLVRFPGEDIPFRRTIAKGSEPIERRSQYPEPR